MYRYMKKHNDILIQLNDIKTKLYIENKLCKNKNIHIYIYIKL